MTEASALIMGSSVPSCTFPRVDKGKEYKGDIVSLEVKQARKFGDTNELAFWKDGTPRMQTVITLQTDLCDPEIENDKGIRRLYVGSKLMREAIADAVRKAGVNEILPGAKLAVKYLKDGEGKNPDNPPKIYAAFYKPPEPGQIVAGPPEAESEDELEPDDYGDYGEEPF